MSKSPPQSINHKLSVDVVTRLDDQALEDLVKATLETIRDGEDSSWRGRPTPERMTAFWKGVAVSPHRHLIIGRLDGKTVGAVQIVQQGPLSEIGPEVASLENFFIAPSARGFGLARRLLRYAEKTATSRGIMCLDVVMREDRSHAAAIVEDLGYRPWARKETFRVTGGTFQSARYYSKILDPAYETHGDTAALSSKVA